MPPFNFRVFDCGCDCVSSIVLSIRHIRENWSNNVNLRFHIYVTNSTAYVVNWKSKIIIIVIIILKHVIAAISSGTEPQRCNKTYSLSIIVNSDAQKSLLV